MRPCPPNRHRPARHGNHGVARTRRPHLSRRRTDQPSHEQPARCGSVWLRSTSAALFDAQLKSLNLGREVLAKQAGARARSLTAPSSRRLRTCALGVTGCAFRTPPRRVRALNLWRGRAHHGWNAAPSAKVGPPIPPLLPPHRMSSLPVHEIAAPATVCQRWWSELGPRVGQRIPRQRHWWCRVIGESFGHDQHRVVWRRR